MQYVLERRELGTRQCASDVRRSEQRGSKSVLCKATLKKPHQRRSQPCVAAGRRAAGARWARRRTS